MTKPWKMCNFGHSHAMVISAGLTTRLKGKGKLTAQLAGSVAVHSALKGKMGLPAVVGCRCYDMAFQHIIIISFNLILSGRSHLILEG